MNRQNKGKNNKKSSNNNQTSKMEIKGIIIIAIGLLSSIAIYTNLAGFLSSFAQKICHLLIGVGSYILPLYLLYLGYSYFKGRGNISLGKKFYGITIFIGVIILVFGTIYIQNKEVPNDFGNNFIELINAVADGKRELNGGVIGYVIAFPLYKFIGGLGSYILYGALIIISCILVFNFSPLKAGQMAKSKGREFREKERAKKKTSEYKDKG